MLNQSYPDEKLLSPSRHPARLLIVDGDRACAARRARALDQLDTPLEVLSAQNGEEALEIAQECQVDILITDFLLGGMNGLELIEKLRGEHEPPYKILLSAYDVPGLAVSARAMKVQEYLIRPVEPEKLRQSVERALSQVRPAPAALSPSKFKILIADDYPDNIRLLATRLKSEGYSYITAADGEETLAKVRQEAPDLVLLDVNMPRKDGFQVLAEMRCDPQIAGIPVIMITAARLAASDVREGLTLGADDYVTKPVDWRELSARIRNKLRVKEAGDQLRQRNRQLEVLPEISQDLGERLDEDDLAWAILNRTAGALGAAGGCLAVFGVDRSTCFQVLHPERLDGLSPEAVKERFLAQGWVAQMRRDHQGQVFPEAGLGWAELLPGAAGSAIAVPVCGRGGVLALLALAHGEPGHFQSGHLPLLNAIASQASIALENAQLYAHVERSQKRLSAVLNGAADAILVTDGQGRLELANPAGEKLFTDVAARVGRPLPAGRGYDPLVHLLELAQASGQPVRDEVAWPDERTFSALVSPLEEGGQVVLLHDISHFKALDRLKSEFVATASHDLKNPLTVIKGYSDLIARAGPLNELQVDFLGRIRGAAGQMQDLVLNLLDIARMDMGVKLDLQALDLNELVGAVLDEFQDRAAEKGHALSADFASEGPFIDGDKVRLQQVVRNLIGNAIKYTPPGGRIRVATRVENGRVSVKVQDTGIGIPPEALPKLFSTFYRVRTKETEEIEGNGLGLAIVKSIVEKHGGQVAVESVPGQGSCFSFTLKRHLD